MAAAIVTSAASGVGAGTELAAAKGSPEAALAAMAKTTPLGRFATAPEIAEAIVALLAAPMTTGTVHAVDGGYSL